MIHSDPSRRAFLARIGGGMLLQSPLLLGLAACAREAISLDEPLTTLTGVEGRAFAAFAARILPAEVGPGATQAGAVYFADRALAGPFAAVLESVREGLADLDARASAAHGNAFADLSARQQDALIREIEVTPFFGIGHLLTVAGVFADPAYGGNRGDVGYVLLGMEHEASYSPPFGFYDAEAARESGGGR